MQAVASPEKRNERQQRWRAKPKKSLVDEHAASEDDADEGHRKVNHMHDPKLSIQAEVLDHQLAHLLRMAWCPHCIRERAKK